MRAMIASLLVVVFLTVGCGKNDQVNTSQINSIRSLASLLMPGTMGSVKRLQIDQLPNLLNSLAQSGQLSQSQQAILLNPVNQQVLAGILGLIKGGVGQGQLSTLNRLLAMPQGVGQGQIIAILDAMFQVFQQVAPMIAMLDPAIAPYIGVALVVIPIVEQFLKSIVPVHPTQIAAS